MNIGPGCLKQYGADVYLSEHSIVVVFDDDVTELLRQYFARYGHIERQRDVRFLTDFPDPRPNHYGVCGRGIGSLKND